MTRFSTMDVPVDERVNLWEEYNEEALFGLRASSLSERSVMATQVNLDMDRVRLTHIRGNDHVIERTQSSIRANPVDAVMLCLLLQGDAFLYHGDGCETLSAGDAVLYDANRPFMYGFATEMRQVIVEVPRALLDMGMVKGDAYRPRVLRLSGSAAQNQAELAARAVLSAFTHETPGDPRVEESILDAFHLLTGGQESLGPHAYLDLATAFIEARLAEDLSVERVAREIGISARHLGRIFTEQETTPGRFIAERRLSRAAELLGDPRSSGWTVGQVGARVGLRQPAHFSRSFKAHFGVTPSEYRAQALHG